jgi:type VI secretion system protein ImpL
LLDAVPGATAQLQQLSETVLSPRRVVNVAKAVTDHFQAFREAVTAEEGAQSQVDALLVAMEPLYRQINHVATGGDILELGAEPQALLNTLSEQVGALPPSLQPLFRRILSQAAAVTSGNSRERLAEIWTSTVLPLCQATTEGRYPFDVKSSEDSSLQDFAGLFGPKGAIASYRNDYLKPFIDTTTKPWQWRTGQQIGLGYDGSVLNGFELADDITTTYFGEADLPLVAFTVEPVRLDPKARAFQLDIGGPTMVYTHGPSKAAAMRWPPETPGTEAGLSMTPEIDGERNILRRQGDWALFRLFDAGRILDREPTDVVPFGFTVGSRQVVLKVTAPATKNPFARDILSGFQCPVL